MGSICGWHPDVGQGVMTIHGDVLAGGATLVLRRLCSVRVVPRLRENGPVVLEVSQALTRAEVASYSLLCESGGRDVAIGASSAKITMRRNGFVVGFAEVELRNGDVHDRRVGHGGGARRSAEWR